jgi:hypothetical protein
MDDEDEKIEEENQLKKHQTPKCDDNYLKFYTKLLYNLNKLMEISMFTENKSDEMATDSNDQPVYSMKIVVLYSQLSSFKIDYWTMINGQAQIKIRKIYTKIRKLLKSTKESINCLFQVRIKSICITTELRPQNSHEKKVVKFSNLKNIKF